jgi:tripartite-type tricarboxylate transporter receptor subunit TctC
MRRTLLGYGLRGSLFGLAAMAVFWPLAALSQDYPTKPITMVVPFAAGGPTDIIARIVGEHMSRTLGQQIVIENVAGAGGTTGTARVATAKPDGYTLLLHHMGFTTAPALYKNLRFNPLTDFEYVGIINSGPMVVLSKKGLEFKSLKELFDHIKANVDKFTLAHAGVGATSHFCGMLLQQVLGTKLTFVTYQGTGPAMNDLVAGQVDAMCDQATSAVPQIGAGTIRAYAVTGDQRIESIKDVPTAKEVGYPQLDVTVWTAVHAPKGTPRDIVNKLNAAIAKALDDKTVVEKFAQVGTQLYPRSEWTPEALAARVKREVAKNKELLSGLAQ